MIINASKVGGGGVPWLARVCHVLLPNFIGTFSPTAIGQIPKNEHNQTHN